MFQKILHFYVDLDQRLFFGGTSEHVSQQQLFSKDFSVLKTNSNETGGFSVCLNVSLALIEKNDRGKHVPKISEIHEIKQKTKKDKKQVKEYNINNVGTSSNSNKNNIKRQQFKQKLKTDQKILMHFS